jgi:hypothetical protein
MEIEFRDIPGFPGYQATSDGRVWSGKRGIFLKPHTIKNRYERINPSVNGKRIVTSLHGLIASAFLGPKPNGFCIDHINEIKTDNRPENLRYLTIGDNVRAWAKNNKARSSARRAKKMTPGLVKELRMLHSAGVTWKDLYKKYNLSKAQTAKIITKQAWGWVE